MIIFFMKFLNLILTSVVIGMLLRVIGSWLKLPEEMKGYDVIVKYTQKIIYPIEQLVGLRRIFGIELSCVFGLVLFLLVQATAYIMLGKHSVNISQIILLILALTARDILNLLAVAMICELLLQLVSWHKLQYFSSLVHLITKPFLNYSRDLLPVMGGFDVAPLFWFVLFKMLAFFIYASMVIGLL